MSEQQEITFRDFAGAIMGNDSAKAASVLEVLLGIEASAATNATAHFQSEAAANPQFMMKAMGLRTAVTSGSDDDIRQLLGDCFALSDDDTATAATALRKR